MALLIAAPLSAATHVTIRELKEQPERYYGQELLLECYYDKESPVWVRALPNADEWIGFFVTGPPDKALTWNGEYYNLLFAPAEMREVLRTLRGGDKITVRGDGFHYVSTSFDGVGLHVRQILTGWGSSARSIRDSAATTPPAGVPGTPSAPSSPELSPSAPLPPDDGGKLAVKINGKR